MAGWQLVTRDAKRTVIERLEIADSFWGRFCGLQFRRPLPPGDGLLLVPCSSIHTMWVRFAIDVAMLDRGGRVLAVRPAVRPWRLATAPRGTHAVLEATAGNLQLEVGDVVALRPLGTNRKPPRELAGYTVVDKREGPAA